jgi:hypothetical protein
MYCILFDGIASEKSRDRDMLCNLIDRFAHVAPRCIVAVGFQHVYARILPQRRETKLKRGMRVIARKGNPAEQTVGKCRRMRERYDLTVAATK